MNTPRSMRHLAAFTAGLLWLTTARAAQPTDYTATGTIISGQASALVITNAVGQVLLRGNMHTAMVIGSDPRVTGRRRIVVDGAYNADGTAHLWGTCYQEHGTWNGDSFIPSGAFWDIRYTGTMGVDNSLQLTMVGSGCGGSIDGLCLEESLTREPVLTPEDPNGFYHYVGQIRPAPINTSVVLDDFNEPPLTGWSTSGTGQGSLTENDGALTVRGFWPGMVTRAHADTYFWATRYVGWAIADGRSVEWRADVVSMTAGSTNAAALVPGSTANSTCYLLYMGSDFIQLGKYIQSTLTVFFHERVAIKNSNVILSLVMTRRQSSLFLTVRVLDKDNHDAVLYQRAFEDTPQTDPTLTSAELLAASGMSLNVRADQPGAPFLSGNAILLNAWQYTDGSEPAVEVVYDNLEMRTYETPHLTLEPSVTLLVPEFCEVEQAPSVTGPWAPVIESTVPGMKRVSVPSRTQSGIFRAVVKP